MQKGIAVLVLMGICIWANGQDQPSPYFGLESPGKEPQVFAPGFISNGLYNRDFTMSPDGKTALFCVVIGQNKAFTILETRWADGKWSEPATPSFVDNLEDVNLEPCMSPGGDRLFFMSNRLEPGETERNEDIWIVDKTPSGWGEPYNLGPPVSTDAAEFFPSLTRDGTLYFTRRNAGERAEFIYRSRLVDGKYSEPEKLGPEVNGAPTQFNAAIAPDESYIVVAAHGREDSMGGIDYYVSFRNADDTWTGPVNLGDKINTPASNEYSPAISLDGKYLFFMSARLNLDQLSGESLTMNDLVRLSSLPENGNPDIYWVEASIIEDLRPAQDNKED